MLAGVYYRNTRIITLLRLCVPRNSLGAADKVSISTNVGSFYNDTGMHVDVKDIIIGNCATLLILEIFVFR